MRSAILCARRPASAMMWALTSVGSEARAAIRDSTSMRGAQIGDDA
jgi:hypothetical protein